MRMRLHAGDRWGRATSAVAGCPGRASTAGGQLQPVAYIWFNGKRQAEARAAQALCYSGETGMDSTPGAENMESGESRHGRRRRRKSKSGSSALKRARQLKKFLYGALF